MLQYGDMPPLAPTLLLVGYSLCWGSTLDSSAWPSRWCRRPAATTRLALAAAPIFWAGLELAAARITSVPGISFGYSQVDNGLVNQLAPWTGVYGISFVLAAVNALIAGGILLDRRAHKRIWGGSRRAWLALAGTASIFLKPPGAPTATAVLTSAPIVSTSPLWLMDGPR